MDIDSLFKVNRVSNAFDIVNEMNFRSSSATEAIGKIEKLSKLVLGANVTIKDIFMAQAIKDNIPDGGRIALINALSILDRQSDHMHFIKFKSAFRQTFSVTPSDTFVNFDNRNKNYCRDFNSQKDQQRDRYRDSRPRNRRPKSPHAHNKNKCGRSGSRSTSCGLQGHSDGRSGVTSVNFHINSPSSSTCLIDTGAQRSCMGQRTFVNLGGNPESLSKSTQQATSRVSSRPRPSRWTWTTKGLPSTSQTQDDRKRQVEGKFAGHKDEKGHKQKTDKKKTTTDLTLL